MNRIILSTICTRSSKSRDKKADSYEESQQVFKKDEQTASFHNCHFIITNPIWMLAVQSSSQQQKCRISS